MSGITVVSTHPDLEQSLVRRFSNKHIVRTVYSADWGSPVAAVQEICAADPDVVVFASDMEHEDAGLLIAELDRRHPTTGTVAILRTPDRDHVVELLRLGATDVVDLASDEETIESTVRRVLEIALQRRTHLTNDGGNPDRKVVVILSPKGGTGKTTTSTNLAVGLAKRAPNQTLLIDLDVQFGDCASALGANPEYSLSHAISSSALRHTALKVFLTMHSSSLALLPPPDNFAEAEDLETDGLKRVLGSLTDEFRYVVIDTAAGIDEFAMVAMEFATDLVFIATTDVPSIRAIQRQVEALDSLGLVGHRRHFVLNRSDARVGLSVSDVEATVGMSASVKVPTSRAFPVSTNQGIPLLATDSRESGARELQKLVDLIAPATEQRTGGWFRRKEN